MQKHHRGIIPTHPNVQEPILNLLGKVGVRQRSPPLENDGVDSQVTAELYPDLGILDILCYKFKAQQIEPRFTLGFGTNMLW